MKSGPDLNQGIQTIGDLINAGADALSERPANNLQQIPLRDQSLVCPLSPAQQRIWFIEQLSDDALAYNESEAARLRGNLDVDVLERAFNIIVDRHELLRSTIRISEGQPTFVVHAKWPLEFKRIDLSARSDAEKEAELTRLLSSEPRRPYRLEAAPGIRTTLVRLGPQEHVFILMMHHIICDWSSEGVLWRELSAFYRALLRGELPTLPPLLIQHGDYAAWQLEHNNSSDFADDLAFWKERLRGSPELLELPTDRPRPPVASNRGAKKRYLIDSPQTEALRQASRRQKISLFSFFAATLNVLLHRYTRSEDIPLGIPLADRDRPELQSMIGFLLHTHVLRTAVKGGMTFSELLVQVQKGALELFTHRAVPFDLVVREVGHERTLSYSPLFQVMLNWRDRDQQLSFIGLEGLAVEMLLSDSKISKFDLALCVTDDGDRIWLEIEYSTDLFDEPRIDRLARHYQILLAAVTADPDRRLSELSLLSPDERHQILLEWNPPPRNFPLDPCVHQLFEEQVERTPDAVAVSFDGEPLTYRQLNERSNQLAHHLRELGVGPESLVGICVERSPEMIIALLGVFKAGGAYVPLDPEYPKERLAFMMNDASVSVLLTQARLASSVPANAAQIVRLDVDWPAIAAGSPANLPNLTQARHLAYMIYTSGSTGNPKGVLIEHGPLVQHCLECCDYYGLTGADRVLQFASLSFDAAIEQILPPLLRGARVVLREAIIWTPEVFQQKLSELGLTVINLPPAYWHQLAEAWSSSLEAVSAHNLRLVIVGGDAMSSQALRLWQETPLGRVRLINAYGPTETVVTATTFEIPALAHGAAPLEKIPIGRPRGAREIYVLDRWLQPVPVGIAGELHIGGAGMARGYHNRPELTAEKFVTHPFSDDPTARLYKTGDLARYLPDGNVEYLGRLDHQVKIRGFRVELGEIEEVLNQHPGVQTSVVLAREDLPGEKRLVAYTVSRNGTISPSQLREYIVTRLPDHMMPASFVTLKALPLNPSGKVDRKALPHPDFGVVDVAGDSAAPRTPTEVVLVVIWCDVLGLKQVGVHDNFFDLGGHSLLAVKLISKINKALKLHLRVLVFFQNPTIEKLATVCEQEVRDPQRSHWTSGDESAAFLIPVQEKGSRPPLFFLHGDWAGGGFYCGRLSQQMGEDQPFYALAPYRSDRQGVVTVEEMVAHHLAVIREQRPKGPYLLGGYCIGATVAMEIARQLVEAGEEVPQLLLLDPPQWVPWMQAVWPVLDRAGAKLGWTLQKRIHYFERAVSANRWIGMSLPWKLRTVGRHLGLARLIGSIPVATEPEDNVRVLKNFGYAVYFLAFFLYRLKPVPVPAALYFADETPPSRFTFAKRAADYFPRLTLDRVLGNHHTCITEHGATLGDRMKNRLARL